MTTLNMQVAASLDDTVVYFDGSAWQITNTNTGHWAGYYSSSILKVGAGARFQNVTIPPGATITSAYLTLTSEANESGTTVKIYIIGDLEPDAAAFSTIADYQARRGTSVGGANNNKRTVACVAWDSIGSWTLDSEYNSPDISAVIQEIINQGGWASGNALVLFWDDHDARGTQSSDIRRVAYAYDYSATKCAKLMVTFTTGVAKTSSETGSGADDKSDYPAAILVTSESGAGAEALSTGNPNAVLSAVEYASGSESISLTNPIPPYSVAAEDGGDGSDGIVSSIRKPGKGSDTRLPGGRGERKMPSRQTGIKSRRVNL